MRRFPSSLLQFNPLDRYPSIFAIGMLCGAIWYFSADFEPSTLAVIFAVLGAALMLIWAFMRAHLPVWLALALFGFGASCGIGAGKLATERLDHASIQAPIGPVLVEGWIKRADAAQRGVRLVIDVHAIDGLAQVQTPRLIRLTHISRLQTEPGRFVRCWAVLRPPPPPVIEGDYDFDRQAWYSGLGAVGYVQGRCRGGTLGAPQSFWGHVGLFVSQMRRQIAHHVNQAAGARAGGFAAALVSGDRSFMASEDQTALRQAGLAHLLAISGLHMGIVGGLAFLIIWRGLALIEPVALRWSVKKPAAFAALVACGAYLIISGASVSTQRAFLMALVFFGAVLVDRAALTQRSLALAMSLIIFLAPWSVLTPGFQMSFAATAALIAVYEAWRKRSHQRGIVRRNKILFWGKSLVVTSVVSSLATMPFALYHFDRVAGLGIVANVIAMPIISLITAPLAAMALIATPIGLEAPFLRGFGVSLEWVLAIANWVGEVSIMPELVWPRMPSLSLAFFSAAFLMVFLTRGRAIRYVSGMSLCLIAGSGWLDAARDRVHWAPSGDVFLEAANGAVTRIKLIEGGGLGPLQFSDIPISQRCETGQMCEVSLNGQKFIFLPPNITFDCASLTSNQILLSLESRSVCEGHAPKLSWQDVVRENGITLERYGNTFRYRLKPECGNRPWRPCRLD